MDDYAGRVLADRYRLPLPPSDAYEFAQTTAFDTYSGQEVFVRQVPLPEVVEAEVLDSDGLPEGFTSRGGPSASRRPGARAASGATRSPSDPAVRRAVEAAQAAAQLPDHPRLDQVFDVFAEDGSLWIVSEMVAASPLAAVLAEGPLSPYRAAEVAADVLTALRALHAHGWVHRNITTRTVLICEDGRVLLTGLAAGAAEEALCGYDPTPDPDATTGDPYQEPADGTGDWSTDDRGDDLVGDRDPGTGPFGPALSAPGPQQALPAPGPERTPAAHGQQDVPAVPGQTGQTGQTVPIRPGGSSTDPRAARAGAIAAYRAGARAAARVQEEGRTDARPDQGGAQGPPGQIADPYGVGPGRIGPPAPGSPFAPRSPGSPSSPGVPQQGHGGGSALAVPHRPGAPATTGGGPDGDTGAGTGWGGGAARRGPTTRLDAERARQARMAVVGPVTERWAPEQASPVHDNWRLAPPVGPATDLWALGALLFRAVQGHAPYPEDSTPELVEMVCSEPPAFAEECGPLRPVVESLLRQDPTERPDFEELRGWLRSLIRSAPEPEAGTHVVAAPPADAERLPIVRRRGELIRRRRGVLATRGRHKRAGGSAPKRLGQTLLALVLAGLVAAVAYAMLFMPKAGSGDPDDTRAGGAAGPTPGRSTVPGSQDGGGSSGAEQPQASHTGLPKGYSLQKDPEGFQLAVPDGWHRQGRNGKDQIVYSRDGLQLIVVPGRDTSASKGKDPMVYQREKEHELQPFRDSSWATSSGMRTTSVGDQVMAEGQFTWQDDNGQVYVRNLALLLAGRYHVVQVRGPESRRDMVDAVYQQAVATYQYQG